MVVSTICRFGRQAAIVQLSRIFIWVRAHPVWAAFLLAITIPLAFCSLLWLTLPRVGEFATRNPTDTALMEYRRQRAAKQREPYHATLRWTPLRQIPDILIRSILIAEDEKFFSHQGFDWQSVQDALDDRLQHQRRLRGASTVTQQLAKNLFLNPTRSPLRKLREAMLTVKLEHRLTKRRILELYLNVIEWGPGIFGIGAAANSYFGKAPDALSAEEAIRLASVLPNPIRFKPTDDSRPRLVQKRLRILSRLARSHDLDWDAYRVIRAGLTGVPIEVDVPIPDELTLQDDHGEGFIEDPLEAFKDPQQLPAPIDDETDLPLDADEQPETSWKAVDTETATGHDVETAKPGVAAENSETDPGQEP